MLSSWVMPSSRALCSWMAVVMGVSTTPGQTALTRMPLGASASAADLTTEMTRAFEAA